MNELRRDRDSAPAGGAVSAPVGSGPWRVTQQFWKAHDGLNKFLPGETNTQTSETCRERNSVNHDSSCHPLQKNKIKDESGSFFALKPRCLYPEPVWTLFLSVSSSCCFHLSLHLLIPEGEARSAAVRDRCSLAEFPLSIFC